MPKPTHALAVLALSAGGAAGQVTSDAIAVSGQDAAGTDARFGAVAFGTDGFRINSHGDFVFRATLAGAPDGANDGIWEHHDGQLTLRSLEGDTSTTGDTYNSFRRIISYTDQRLLSFEAQLSSSPGSGYLTQALGGPLTLGFKSLDPLVGRPDRQYSGGAFRLWDSHGSSRSGHVVGSTSMIPVGGGLGGTYERAATYIDPAGNIQTLTVQGDPFTAIPGDNLVSSVGSMTVGNEGTYLFGGNVRPVGGTATSVIWAGRDGSLDPIMIEGQTLAGLPSIAWNGFGADSSIADDGTAYIRFRSTAGRETIASYRDGTFDLVMRERDVAFNGPPRSVFGRFDNLQFNHDGAFAFDTILQGSGTLFSENETVWSSVDGVRTLIAREGGAVDDLAGVTYAFDTDSLNQRDFFATGGIARTNDVAFRSFLMSDLLTIDETNDEALFLYEHAAGRTHLLVREGDVFEYDLGETLTSGIVDAFEFLDFADDGTAYVSLTFESGDQGLFAFAVPAPGSAALLALAAAGARRRRA